MNKTPCKHKNHNPIDVQHEAMLFAMVANMTLMFWAALFSVVVLHLALGLIQNGWVALLIGLLAPSVLTVGYFPFTFNRKMQKLVSDR
jgi:uncharacterized membrane protein